MRRSMQGVVAVVLGGLSLAAAAAGSGTWTYVVVAPDGGASFHNAPPHDLTYPPSGTATPVVPADDGPATAAARQGGREQGHLIIIGPERAPMLGQDENRAADEAVRQQGIVGLATAVGAAK